MPRAKRVLASRDKIVKHAAKTKDIDFGSFVSVFEFVLSLILNDLGWLPANAALDSIRMVTAHLGIKHFCESHV